jgi:hypothetical protein
MVRFLRSARRDCLIDTEFIAPRLVGVSNLALTSKFIVRVLGSGGWVRWHKIYTGSGGTYLLPVTGGLRYRQH